MVAKYGRRNGKPWQTRLLDRHPSVLSSSKYPIMGTRWTYPKKTDDNGTFTQYRGHLIAKGLSQVLGVDYFESFSPVASFVTIHTLLVFQVLTDLPMFEVYQYDVQLVSLMLQIVIDPSHPPVYCEQPESYEDQRQHVHQLHKHLYGMKDSPRGWSKQFSSVSLKYGFAQLMTDECDRMRVRKNCSQHQVRQISQHLLRCP